MGRFQSVFKFGRAQARGGDKAKGYPGNQLPWYQHKEQSVLTEATQVLSILFLCLEGRIEKAV